MSVQKNKALKKSRLINNILLVLLMLTTVAMLVAFGFNIYKIVKAEAEEEKVIEVEKPENEFINEYYTIGHNATVINKEYFRELNAALDSGDQSAIATAVTKCFITEYYTWTNKDGNYDVGGMQYIFADDQHDFEVYSRYNFYQDMDLYISQLGRSNLIKVSSVTVDSCEATTYADRNAYRVSASWTYESEGMSTEDVQNSATFTLVDRDGRWEIAAID